MGKVKLPPLPESEPKGSIATYLAQVRQKRADEDSTMSLTENQEAASNTNQRVEGTASPTDDSSILSTNLLSNLENNGELNNEPVESVTEADVHQDSPIKQEVVLSKILDKTTEESSSVTQPNQENSLTTNVATIHNSPELNLNRRPRPKNDSPGDSKLAVVKYINSVPQLITEGRFKRGESKIRLSEEMAELVHIIVDCSTQIETPKYLADNLVNQLLKEFFLKYALDIEQLSIEQQQQQLLQNQNKLRLLKRRTTS